MESGKRSGFWLRPLLSDWDRRLQLLLLGTILLQLLIVFIELYAETFHLPSDFLSETAYVSVAAGFFIEWLPCRYRLLRVFLYLFSAALWVMVSLHFFIHFHSLDELRVLIWLNLWKITRVFGLAVLLMTIYLLLTRLISTQIRTILLILILIVFFAILDSYVNLQLWIEVMTLIISGLCLLLLTHIRSLKISGSKAWIVISEYPSTILLPFGAICIVVFLIGILAPDTAPLLHTSSEGASVHTVSTSNPVSELDSTIHESLSGYRRDDQVLGGAFNFDASPVFTVDAGQPLYWRGETRSIYTGKGWVNPSAVGNTLSSPVTTGQQLSAEVDVDLSKLKTVKIRQTIHFEPSETLPVLPGAYQIRTILELDGQANQPIPSLNWSSNRSELHYVPVKGQPFPESYTLISDVPLLDETGLRSVREFPHTAAWQPYLQLPAALPSEVRDLAVQITQNANTPYDKVKSIEHYLSTHYTYNNQPPSAIRNEDFVANFLFQSKQGYCDYFSTAMAVLTRSIGIPTRWVKGFTTGQITVNDQTELFVQQQAKKAAAGVYTVRNADAHSWVEVYFPGYGWIPFDPTPGFSMPAVTPEVDHVIPTVGVNYSIPSLVTNTHWLDGQWLMILFSFLIMVFVLFISFQNRRFIIEWKIEVGILLTKDPKRKIELELKKLFQLFRRLGFAAADDFTLREILEPIRVVYPDYQYWEELIVGLEQFKYSALEMTDSELHSIHSLVSRLRQVMPGKN